MAKKAKASKKKKPAMKKPDRSAAKAKKKKAAGKVTAVKKKVAKAIKPVAKKLAKTAVKKVVKAAKKASKPGAMRTAASSIRKQVVDATHTFGERASAIAESVTTGVAMTAGIVVGAVEAALPSGAPAEEAKSTEH